MIAPNHIVTHDNQERFPPIRPHKELIPQAVPREQAISAHVSGTEMSAALIEVFKNDHFDSSETPTYHSRQTSPTSAKTHKLGLSAFSIIHSSGRAGFGRTSINFAQCLVNRLLNRNDDRTLLRPSSHFRHGVQSSRPDKGRSGRFQIIAALCPGLCLPRPHSSPEKPISRGNRPDRYRLKIVVYVSPQSDASSGALREPHDRVGRAEAPLLSPQNQAPVSQARG
jgi:hypothetical protein